MSQMSIMQKILREFFEIDSSIDGETSLALAPSKLDCLACRKT
jgi:hypothetical protein